MYYKSSSKSHHGQSQISNYSGGTEIVLILDLRPEALNQGAVKLFQI